MAQEEEEEEEVCSRSGLCFGDIQALPAAGTARALAGLFPALRSVRSEQSQAGSVEGVGQKISS